MSKREAMKAIEQRQAANLNILNHLAILARSCPDLRFGQLLAMVDIVKDIKGVSREDAACFAQFPAGLVPETKFWKNEFYLESTDLELRMIRAIGRLPK